MSRRKVRHSWLLSWYFGLPFSWGDLAEWCHAKRAGARTGRMIRDMNEASTVEMPRVEAAPSGRHALRPLTGEGA